LRAERGVLENGQIILGKTSHSKKVGIQKNDRLKGRSGESVIKLKTLERGLKDQKRSESLQLIRNGFLRREGSEWGVWFVGGMKGIWKPGGRKKGKKCYRLTCFGEKGDEGGGEKGLGGRGLENLEGRSTGGSFGKGEIVRDDDQGRRGG